LTFRADDALANSTVNIVSLDAVKALSESSIEVKAFSRDGDAAEFDNILSGRANNDDLSAGSIGVELVVLADAGEAFA
jgi:hypothetical protein